MPAETEPTVQDKFDKAIARVQAEGLAIHADRFYCCSSCAAYEISQEYGNTPVAYLTNAQNHELGWEDGIPFFFEEGSRENGDPEFGRIAEQIWFHYNDIKVATAVALAFSTEGFEVDWDGTESQGVGVTLFNMWAPSEETSLDKTTQGEQSDTTAPSVRNTFVGTKVFKGDTRSATQERTYDALPSRPFHGFDAKFPRTQEPPVPYVPRSDEEQENDVMESMPRRFGARGITVWNRED